MLTTRQTVTQIKPLEALIKGNAWLPSHTRETLHDSLFSAMRGTHALAALTAVFLAATVLPHSFDAVVALWLAFMLGCEAVLGHLGRTHQRHALGGSRSHQWYLIYSLTHFLVSAGWGGSVWLFLPADSFQGEMVVAFLLAAIGAAGVTLLSYCYRLYGLGLVLTLSPVTVYMLSRTLEEPKYGLLGVISLGLTALLLRMGWTTYRERVQALDAQQKVSELNKAETSFPTDVIEHDSVSGVYNLRAFMERAEQTLQDAETDAKVIVLNLDRFSLINDALGMAAADYVLKSVGYRLNKAVGSQGFVARIASDDFVLLHLDKEARSTRLAREILKHMREPVIWNERKLVLSSTLGLAFYPEHGNDIESLLQAGITAMRNAKRDDRGTFRVFKSELGQAARSEKHVEIELANAVERQELFLVYQPKVRLTDDAVIGVEALVRWQSLHLGSVSPGDFIPVAERSGYVHEIGRWVMHEACRQGFQWYTKGIGPLSMAVNVSAPELLSPHFIDHIGEALNATGLPPRLLQIEVTETAFISAPKRVASTLNAVRAMGVTVALDDFGIGYSSLNYLRELPADCLKLDRAFVDDLYQDQRRLAIIRTVVTLCKELGLDSVAEGVESETDLAALREEQCDYVQGFLFSRPLSPNALLNYLGVKTY